MAHLIYFVLFMALCISHSNANYCLCKDGVDSDELQKALDYACGFGADCGPIQPNGPCYEPNTVKDHCDYAVNSYYQNMQSAGGTCDFAGAAKTSPTPPSKISSGCVYPSGPGDSGTNPTPTTPPSFGTPTTPPTFGTPTTPPSFGTPTTPPSFGTPPSFETPTTPPVIQDPPSTGISGTVIPDSPPMFGTAPPKSKNDSSNVKGNNTMLLLLLILAISLIAFRA